MNSSSNRKPSEPLLTMRADERPTLAYQQMAAAKYQRIAAAEHLARVTNYTPSSKPIESYDDDVLIARLEERLAHAYEQIAHRDEQLTRLTEQLSGLEHDVARHRLAVVEPRPAPGRPALRGLIGLLVAACIFTAAFVSQSSHGTAAMQTIARWAPQLVSSLPLPPPLKKFGLPVKPSSSVVAEESVPR
jgi:hypothetical protein